MKHSLRLILLLVTPALILSDSVGKENNEDSDKEAKAAAFWKSVYEENHVVEIGISLTKEAWEAMQPAQSERGRRGPGGQGPGEPRGERPPRGEGERPPGGGGPRGGSDSDFEYVKANLTIDGELFKDTGLRFKGNSSYRFSSRGYKRPLKIDTNRFVKGQKLHGRTKVNLSTAFLDSAFMKEKLGYEVYKAAGIPTPGTGWAKVTLSIDDVLDKEVLGVYVLIEQVDKRYLVRQFSKETKGSLLMKPEGPTDWPSPGEDTKLYEEAFSIKDGEDDDDQIRQFGEFLKFIKEASDADFAQSIGEKLDLDLFAGYLAATSLLASVDSYIGMPHNYYLLMDKADDKVKLLPWDVNEAFGTFSMGTSPDSLARWDIDRPWVSTIPLVTRLFATESFPKLYRGKVTGLMKEHFTEKQLLARMDTFETALAPHLDEQGLKDLRMGIDGDDSGYNTAVSRRVLALKPFIKQRIASVNAQLAGTEEGETIEGRSRGRRGPGGPRGRRPRN